MGKLIDQCINVEGTCTIVLKTHVADGQYSFLTQNSGHDTVKSPIGMFPSYAIDNDLNYVDEKIRNYYEIGDFKSDEEIAEADKDAAKEEIEKPSTEKKSRRARKGNDEKEEKPTETSKEEAKTEAAPKRRRKQAKESADNVDESVDAEPSNESDDEVVSKTRKRRVRKSAVTKPDDPAPEEGFMNVPDDISDEEVPFTGGEPTPDEPKEEAASATRRRRRRA